MNFKATNRKRGGAYNSKTTPSRLKELAILTCKRAFQVGIQAIEGVLLKIGHLIPRIEHGFMLICA